MINIEDWNKHSIIGSHIPNQGITQTVPELMLICFTCGYMRASDYHNHLYEMIV